MSAILFYVVMSAIMLHLVMSAILFHVVMSVILYFREFLHPPPLIFAGSAPGGSRGKLSDVNIYCIVVVKKSIRGGGDDIFISGMAHLCTDIHINNITHTRTHTCNNMPRNTFSDMVRN